MKRTAHKWILTGLVLLWHVCTHAQLEEIARFTTEDGLPSNTVYDILEDKEGYIWMATAGGVVKWNGYDWKVFGKKDGLPTSNIWQLHLDNQQRLWCINHINPGYYIFNDSIYQVNYTEHAKITHPEIELLSNGIAVIAENSWAFTDRLLTTDEQLEILFRQAGYSKILNGSRLRKLVKPGNEEISNFLEEERLKDKDTHCWNLFYKRTPIILNRYKNTISAFDSTFQIQHILKIPRELGAFHPFKSMGSTFILSGTRGQVIYDFDTWKMIDSIIYDDGFNHSRSLIKRNFAIAGSLDNGFRIYSRNYSKSSEQKSLLLCYSKNDFITQSKSDTKLHWNSKITSFNKFSISGTKVFKDENHCYLFKDDTLSYWSKKGNLEQFLIQRHPRHYRTKYRGKIRSYLTSSMSDFQFDANNIYLSDNVVLWHGNKERICTMDTIQFRSSSLFQFKNSAFAIRENKIYQLNGNKQELYWESKNDKNITQCIGVDDHLLCSTDSTIFRLHQKKEQTIIDGITDVNHFNFDGQHLVFNDNTAIYILRLDSEKWKKTSIKNWLPSNTIKGLILHNDSLTILGGDYTMSLNIDSISTKNSNIPFSISCNSPELDNKKNTHERNFNFRATAISPFSLENINYSYRLLPADSTWTTSRSRDIRFTSLSPKKYTLEAQAVDAFGVTSSIVSYDFRVLPYWYQSLCFYILTSTFIIGLTSYLMTRNIRRRAKRLEERQELEKRISTVQLDALRSQMNPHFVFNSLAAIQNYIRLSKKEEADDYLTLFAQLIRSFFEYSQKPHISIQAELELINKYINLENLRFNNEIDYVLTINENVDRLAIIPSLILQPFIENSIHHGLFHKSGYKQLSLFVDQNEESLHFTITDNGIGRKKSGQFRSKNHKSRGSEIMRERFDTINATGKFEVTLHIEDFENPTGTKVNITIKTNEV